MTLSNVRATLGLNATATLGAAGTSGSIQLGQANQTIALTSATSGYSSQLVFANSGDATTLDLLTNAHTSTTTWVAGAAQVETATAAGTVSATGNASVVITAAGMTGSPKTLAVAVANGDTAATWAGKVRTALAADADVSALFTVSGSTTSIVLTRKPSYNFTVPGGTLPIYVANDATLNIALATGTAAGITTASTSANTTAGVASDGVKIYDGDGKDIEGTTVSLASIYGVSFLCLQSQVGVSGASDSFQLSPSELMVKSSQLGVLVDEGITFTASGVSSLLISVFGE